MQRQRFKVCGPAVVGDVYTPSKKEAYEMMEIMGDMGYELLFIHDIILDAVLT